MPSLRLSGSLTLFVPHPGRSLYEVRKALVAQGADILWHGRVAKLGEWQARHWVGLQLNVHQGPAGGYRDYATEQSSGSPGLGGALLSLHSALCVLQPGVDLQAVEAVVARVK